MNQQSKQLLGLSLHFSDGYDEVSGESSPVMPSSPDGPTLASPTIEDKLAVLNPHMDGEDTETDDDPEYTVQAQRKPALSLEQKISKVLDFMRTVDKRLSLYQFFSGIFDMEADSAKIPRGKFYSDNSHVKLMDLWWRKCGGVQDADMVELITKCAAEICNREASFVTNRASEGPFAKEAETLRIASSDMNVEKSENFRLSNLETIYKKVTPNFQRIITGFTTPLQHQDVVRNRDHGRVMITSMALNLRSLRTNYHQAINSLFFWDNKVSKQVVQLLNHFGICSSYSFQNKAIISLSKNAVDLARNAANDVSKIKMLPYDNFNWMSHAWEKSAVHKSQTHDQVSALLVILPTPPGQEAQNITAINQFKKTSRHDLDAGTALPNISATSEDQISLFNNFAIHIQNILAELNEDMTDAKPVIPQFTNDRAIIPLKTEEYYLPTFDQEQGSTRGNMVVLEHYFGKVLGIPKETFEHTMFTVLGDRLTVSRDRAAQDQRALDLSPHAFDHLSSISMVGGLMHYEMNFISAIAGNFWGDSNKGDAVSLSSIHKLFPNLTDINKTKINYYAWLRFLEVILKALVFKAAMIVTKTSSINELGSYLSSGYADFAKLSAEIVKHYVVSPTKLEALGIKKIAKETLNGHAVLLFRDILTVREMHDAVKCGHPTRVLRVLKLWMPMFYAARRYNYANECMEMLHSILHEWPKPYADVALKGMFFSPRGRPNDFKPTDLRVEHLNDHIKEHTRGSNATPSLLEKIVPAMGYLQNLTDNMFEEAGVENLNQRHHHVSQNKDILIVLQHFDNHNVFDFTKDKPSLHLVTDLFEAGVHQVSGDKGGHVRHLGRHKLRLMERHNLLSQMEDHPVGDDTTAISYSLGSLDEDSLEMMDESDEY